MYEPKLKKEIRCPLEYGLDIFGGKWKPRIICVLAEKKCLRYNEIRREMTNITDTVLAATLDRKQYNEIPLRVEYSLTNKGVSVIPILKSICQWSGAYHRSDSEHVLSQCQKCDYIFR